MSQIQNSFLGGVPASGPQALFTKIELIPPAATVVDLKIKFDTGLFMGCQAVYIDALDSAGDIEMLTSFGQRITARKGTQGYYPILEGTDMRFTFKTSATSQDAVTVFFLNQPIAVGVWGETILPATAETLGLVMIGSGITVSADGTISVAAPEIPIASDSVLGGVKIGAGLSIDEDGVLSATGGGGGGGGDYVLPIATPTNLGGVKIGAGLSIDEEGILSSTGGGGLQSYGVASYSKSSNSFFLSGLTDATQTITETSKNAAFKLPSGLYLITMTVTTDDIARGIVSVAAFFNELYAGEESEIMSLVASVPKDRRTSALSATYYFGGGSGILDMILKLPYNYMVNNYYIQFFKLA